MPRWKCNACGGSYSDTQADASVYCHTCPPNTRNHAGDIVPVVSPRDENYSPVGPGGFYDIVSHGSGVTPLDGQVTAAPSWIDDLRATKRP